MRTRVIRGKSGQVARIQDASSPGFTFPSLDISGINDAVSGMYGFLAPVLLLVGGISIGGLLLHKARGLF
jgi:hypothetical protein